MDDLQFSSWYNNLQDHDFDSDNMFLNRIHPLLPTDWPADDQAANIAADLVCTDYNNGFHDIKNEISGDLSVTPAVTTTANSTGSDRVSVLMFSDCCNKSTTHNNNIVVAENNNSSGVSSGDHSVTDDGAALSQCSSGKRPISCVDGRVVNSDNNTNNNNVVVFKTTSSKRSRISQSNHTGRQPAASSNINFQQPGNPSETDMEAIAQMKEMIYREAAFRPVSFVAEMAAVEKPRRKNVRISSDPQTVAARQRRERISERIRVLQKLVPGGNKMDTASMLDEAANYLKFLRSQVKALEQIGQNSSTCTTINAGGTRAIFNSPHHASSLVLPQDPFPFHMQTHYQFGHENLYPNPPPAN